MHIIALSPASSSEPVIGVPSAFDTNIYTTRKHALAHTSGRSETHPPRCNPLPCARGKVAERSVRHGQHKDVIKRGEEGGRRRGGERGEGGGRGREEGGGEGERLLHLSQVRLGSQGRRSPFPSPRLRAKEVSGTEGKKREKTSMTKRDAADMSATRH